MIKKWFGFGKEKTEDPEKTPPLPSQEEDFSAEALSENTFAEQDQDQKNASGQDQEPKGTPEQDQAPKDGPDQNQEPKYNPNQAPSPADSPFSTNNPSGIVQQQADDAADEEHSPEDLLPAEDACQPSPCQGEDTDFAAAATDEPSSFFARLKAGLSKTTQNLSGKIDTLLRGHAKIDEDVFEELEEILLTSDVGYETTMVLSEGLRKRIRDKRIEDILQIKEELSALIEERLTNQHQGLNIDPSPAVLIIVGVNGVGKTTTVGKLASQIKSSGKTVLLVAADTFRAAAAEQLEEWGRRAGVPVIRQQEGADPSAVIFDGIRSAKAQQIDVLLCDTAGRLHNKKNLMQELGKIFRIVDREYPEAQKEILLVIDATTGQNAIAQAKTFMEVAPLTGLILTKLDGTARGGVVLGIHEELHLPVKYIGVGEKLEDLQKFDPKSFAKALFQS